MENLQPPRDDRFRAAPAAVRSGLNTLGPESTPHWTWGPRPAVAMSMGPGLASGGVLRALSLLVLLFMILPARAAETEEVWIAKVPTQGVYTMRSHTYGDQANKSSTLWAVRSSRWQGARRAFCIEPGIPLTSGPQVGRLVEVGDERVMEALSLVDRLPADLAHAVALEAMADDDLDLRTGETRFAVPRDWGRIERDQSPQPVWRLELPDRQNLVVFGGPWDGKTYEPPVYPVSSPLRWWHNEPAWRPAPVWGSYYGVASGGGGAGGGGSGGGGPGGGGTAPGPRDPSTNPPAISVVPLPPGIWLFISGLMGLLAVATRRLPLAAR